jgi:hypothetical protein
MPTNNLSGLNLGGGAAGDLGLGDMLSQQVSGETEEQRKKRMAQMAMTKTMSPAAISLLGGYGGSAA